jgi:hypothetical protein
MIRTKTIVFFILACTATLACQKRDADEKINPTTHYYYYFDEKIFIQSDSSRAILIGKDTEELKSLSKILNQTGIENYIKGNRILVTIFHSKKGRNKVYQEVTQNYPSVFISYSYRHLNEYLDVLNEIILKPHDSPEKIKQSFAGKIKIKEIKKNDIVLFEVVSGNVLEIANNIHEQGLTEWCHPNFISNHVLSKPLL